MLDLWQGHYGYHEVTPQGIDDSATFSSGIWKNGTGPGLEWTPRGRSPAILRFGMGRFGAAEKEEYFSPFTLGLYTNLLCECAHESLAKGRDLGSRHVAASPSMRRGFWHSVSDCRPAVTTGRNAFNEHHPRAAADGRRPGDASHQGPHRGRYKPHDRIPTEAEPPRHSESAIIDWEAIKIFQHLGILESRKKTGTYVCDSSHISTEALTWAILLAKGDLFELVDLREIIEREALALLTTLVRKRSGKSALPGRRGELGPDRDHGGGRALPPAGDPYPGRITISMARSSGRRAILYVSIYATLRSFMLEEIKKTNVSESERSAMLREHRAIAAAMSAGKEGAAGEAFSAIWRRHGGGCGALWAGTSSARDERRRNPLAE